ncbi:hypothetical protein K504DRAFT_201358 [Pleomassaria siparia CBS 279.74]|uniref:Uncharacterized protein n=1 Tax=Pleomassaria siparia CBS 279.74 TaxID=1314801 RepID=A0A6G1KIK3_9PLEO|nr:hypothetical protein K504DRAFT_201358 [Pleomassaria siparia CBS 279.74]
MSSLMPLRLTMPRLGVRDRLREIGARVKWMCTGMKRASSADWSSWSSFATVLTRGRSEGGPFQRAKKKLGQGGCSCFIHIDQVADGSLEARWGVYVCVCVGMCGYVCVCVCCVCVCACVCECMHEPTNHPCM